MAASSSADIENLINTPAMPPTDPSQDEPEPQSQSQPDRLTSLIARATAAYAIKDYTPAAELYSEATELQAEMNGEMAVKNADLLYSYGKCLYYVAVSKSDVLGGGAAGAKLNTKEEGKGGSGKKRKANGETVKAEVAEKSNGLGEEKEERKAEGVITTLVEQKDGPLVANPTTKEANKPGDQPYFQITGDENWDADSDEDVAGDQDAAGEEEDEEDDFVNAFEVLDLARVLLLRKVEALQSSAAEAAAAGIGKGKNTASDDAIAPEVRSIQERIADIHDLQAEISLEGEKFSNAVTDLQAVLALKEKLFPAENSVLAECHYKLSLALEFAAVTQQHDSDGNPLGDPVVDEEMRTEAARQMEKAIQSCNLRISKEENQLHTLQVVDGDGAGDGDVTQKEKLTSQIADVKEMVADMEQRLVELRKPPVRVKEEEAKDAKESMSGILAQILGENKDEQRKVLEQASLGANDLSAGGLVRRKKEKGKLSPSSTNASTPTPAPAAALDGVVSVAVNANGKRKAVDFAEEVEELGTGTGTVKRARVEDSLDRNDP